MNPLLRVEVGRQANFEYEVPPVEETEQVWLGRGAFCQIRISDPQLSRRHCEFTYQDGRLYVEDLDSKNGTRVNDELIEEKTELEDRDTVTVGSSVLRVVFPQEERAARPGLAELGTSEEEQEAYEEVAALGGQELGGYVLEKIVFDGRSSVVFRAHDAETEEPAAVKVLKPLSSVTIEDKNRFVRGAKHSATLRHPNIVRVHKGGRVNSWFFVAMEFVRGKSLKEAVEAKGGPLKVATATRIVRQVLDALQHAYENDIVFRAVRPDNVIVCEGLQVKLTDFDLVKPLTGRQEAQVTRVMDGSIEVDPQYAAPELIAYPVVADQKADIFGAGALLYYMLCARPPFGKHLPADKLSSAFDRAVPDLQSINPDVPQSICDVVARAMSDYERYNTPREMLEALEQTGSDSGA